MHAKCKAATIKSPFFNGKPDLCFEEACTLTQNCLSLQPPAGGKGHCSLKKKRKSKEDLDVLSKLLVL